MSNDLETDLIRWNFRVDAEKAQEIETYLSELGMDVTIYEDGHFTVLWDDPDRETDPIIEQLWEMNGEAFDVTHEAFHRVSLLVYHTEEETEEDATDDAEPEQA